MLRKITRRAGLFGLLLGLPVAVPATVPAPDSTTLAACLAQAGLRATAARQVFRQGLAAFASGDLALAERLWQPAARAGDADAAYHLALLYERRTPGAVAVLIWYRRAARQGHSDAQHNLGLALMNGEGVPVDMAQALYWWRKAARQGNVDSQYNLGLVFALGQNGLRPDRARARYWWLQAARHGDAAAQYNLATLYASEPARPDFCQARRWFTASSRNGFTRASEALARLPEGRTHCKQTDPASASMR